MNEDLSSYSDNESDIANLKGGEDEAKTMKHPEKCILHFESLYTYILTQFR